MKVVGNKRRIWLISYFLDIQQVDQTWSWDHAGEGHVSSFNVAVMQYHFEDPGVGGGRTQDFRKFPRNFREISGNFSENSQKFPGNFPTPPGVWVMYGWGVPTPRGVINVWGGVCPTPWNFRFNFLENIILLQFSVFPPYPIHILKALVCHPYCTLQ